MIAWKILKIDWSAIRSSIDGERVPDHPVHGIAHDVESDERDEWQGTTDELLRKLGHLETCARPANKRCVIGEKEGEKAVSYAVTTTNRCSNMSDEEETRTCSNW